MSRKWVQLAPDQEPFVVVPSSRLLAWRSRHGPMPEPQDPGLQVSSPPPAVPLPSLTENGNSHRNPFTPICRMVAHVPCLGTGHMPSKACNPVRQRPPTHEQGWGAVLWGRRRRRRRRRRRTSARVAATLAIQSSCGVFNCGPSCMITQVDTALTMHSLGHFPGPQKGESSPRPAPSLRGGSNLGRLSRGRGEGGVKRPFSILGFHSPKRARCCVPFYCTVPTQWRRPQSARGALGTVCGEPRLFVCIARFRDAAAASSPEEHSVDGALGVTVEGTVPPPGKRGPASGHPSSSTRKAIPVGRGHRLRVISSMLCITSPGT